MREEYMTSRWEMAHGRSRAVLVHGETGRTRARDTRETEMTLVHGCRRTDMMVEMIEDVAPPHSEVVTRNMEDGAMKMAPLRCALPIAALSVARQT